MSYYLPNPSGNLYSKTEAGISDTFIFDDDGNQIYCFANCPIVDLSASVGLNSQASSLTVTIAEDPDNDLYFAFQDTQFPGAEDLIVRQTGYEPEIPSLWAISLPKGSSTNGSNILPNFGTNDQLQPNAFVNTTCPFYFAGILTSYDITDRSSSGKTISLTISDPRELMSHIQVLLGSFAMTQVLTDGEPRYTGFTNVIDVFGAYSGGFDSERNEYGMLWSKIKTVLEDVRVTLYNINFEFYFTGDAFLNAPNWYRVQDETIDLLALVQKICNDAGSDLFVYTRKITNNTAIVEFRSIKRAKDNDITRGEINTFINARNSIVDAVNIGVEFRNEPTSKIVVGGPRNKNYVAYPGDYNPEWHINISGIEDYEAFPDDIKYRMHIPVSGDATENGRSGAIYPYWGMSPSGDIPMAEPFISLDHLSFDIEAQEFAQVRSRVPLCKIDTYNPMVRNRPHYNTFLQGDEEPDRREFGYLSEYLLQYSGSLPGYVRGLPLNTEVIRAASVSKNFFDTVYSMYYPDIALSFGMSAINWEEMFKYSIASSGVPDIKQYANIGYVVPTNWLQVVTNGAISDGYSTLRKAGRILDSAWDKIYELVKGYSEEYYGKQFMVCLPKSTIMNRIRSGQSVPTNPDRPDIEYTVDNRGYWEDIPSEFDGISPSGTRSDQEEQIRRKFMAEDNRFFAMAVMDVKPSGNASFNANGINKAMLEQLPTSEFRPNRIAETTPDYVCISASIEQLVKTPDIAILNLPTYVEFDPTNGITQLNIYGSEDLTLDDEEMVKYSTILRMFKIAEAKDDFAKLIFGTLFTSNGIKLKWAMDVAEHYNMNRTPSKLIETPHSVNSSVLDRERVLDLKGVIVPLTSRWSTYGPYYYTDGSAGRNIAFDIDDSLVPWNFNRAPAGSGWYAVIDEAGNEKKELSRADLQKVTTARISVAGFPEFGPGDRITTGKNSNFNSISVQFGAGGIKTTYTLGTYAQRPGTYRKYDFDNVSRARVDNRPMMPDIINENLTYTTMKLDGSRFGRVSRSDKTLKGSY